jgi:hypothetical protein
MSMGRAFSPGSVGDAFPVALPQAEMEWAFGPTVLPSWKREAEALG